MDQEQNPIKIDSWRKDTRAIEKFQFMRSFLPQPEKKSRSPFLSNGAIFVYCIIILSASTVFRFIPKLIPGVLGYASNINVSDLLVYTNKKRTDAGLNPLVLNEKLSIAAEKKAYDMFDEDYWAHVSPSGVEPWDFILSEGYDYIYAGENLAKNFSTSKEVVEGWYRSPSHKSNLLSSNYDEIGFAVVNGTLNGYETTLVVQMFGRPRDSTMIASVYEGDQVLEDVSQRQEIEVPVKGTQITVNPEKVEPKVDITIVSKAMSLAFGGFVIALLVIDIWYSKKTGTSKFTGHTFAHLVVLVMAVISIWFVLRPGIIL